MPSAHLPDVPDSFKISFEKAGTGKYILRTSQIYLAGREGVFDFFEDPRNLFHITPAWLDFRLENPDRVQAVSEGAEFHYHIKWLGIKLKWTGRIVNYRPPSEFTDVQVRGPYTRWEHTHRFQEIPGGTLMLDEVQYTLPGGIIGDIMHTGIIRRQLHEIFSFRSIKTGEQVEAKTNRNK